MENNMSISGGNSQKLSLFKKIGSSLFIIGVLGLIYAFRKDAIEYARVYAFFTMLIGAILFTYKDAKHLLSFVYTKNTNFTQKAGLFLSTVGLFILLAAWFGMKLEPYWLYLSLSLGSMAIGILIYTYGTYAGHTKGIKNNHVWHNSLTNKGILGWISGILLTGFYVQLYWFSDSLAELIHLFDPLALLLKGKAADQWFVYGTIYSFVILFLGIKFIVKYRHNKYQFYRTLVVIASQLILAYFLPNILESMNDGIGYFNKDLKQVWPLNYYFTEGWSLDNMTKEQNAGPSGFFFFIWGLFLFLVLTPLLTYFVGKRWYCSWVCGCGGLAETAGDSFRQLSSKTEISWKIERWVIHSVMVFVLAMTVATLWPYFSGKDYEIGILSITKIDYLIFIEILLGLSAIGLIILAKKRQKKILMVGGIIMIVIGLLLLNAYVNDIKNIFYIESKSIKKFYGFFVGAAFSGVIGVGFYPILGNRVWCRFGCPMAGYMGLFQRFKSRFRITTNGSQCISCGNCSTYCEQGIDVRAYAQKGENIVRASCVGCGVCSAVCPRGVLKLENGPEEGRFDSNPLEITKEGVKLNM